MTQPTTDLRDRFLRLQPAVVCDVMDAMGLANGVLANTIRLVDPKSVLCGVAFCVRGTRVVGARPAPTSGSRPVFEIDRRLRAGTVFVGETAGCVGAAIGGNMALAFKQRGAAGIVLDGPVRDVDELIEMGLATAATGTTPMSFKGLFEWSELDVPVRMPGQLGQEVVIRTGDVILGDVDGLLVVPAEHAADVARHAAGTMEMEERIKTDLAQGHDREEVYARHDRFAHIDRG